MKGGDGGKGKEGYGFHTGTSFLPLQALRVVPLPMTLSDLQGHSPTTNLLKCDNAIFSERELTFTFAICLYAIARPSACLSSACLSSVTFVRPTQAVQIFGNISTALGTLAIR